MAGGVGLEPTGWQFWRLLQYQLCDPPINQIGAFNDIPNRPSIVLQISQTCVRTTTL